MPTLTPYAQCETRFFERLTATGFNPELIVDIGGSNAAWSTSVSVAMPDARYEIFEPLAGRREEYDRVLEWALRTHPNFRLHPVAIGDVNGEAEFWNEAKGVGSSLLVRNTPAEQRIRVPVRRLDDYLREHGIRQPRVIKADVQGAEMRVIEGGRVAFAGADVLHLETWLMRGYGPGTPLLTEIIDALRPMGHKLVMLGDFWRNPKEELVSVDAFFAHERLIDGLRAAGAEFPWPANWEG